MSTNIINTNGDLGLLKASAKIGLIINEFGQNLFTGEQILNVKDIGDLKSQCLIVVVCDVNGDSI